VPRDVNGETNRFHVRRLKQKLGTRAMASGEADFVGAWAEPVGELDRSFKNVVEHVLNTSRLYNALTCAGAMTAAYREAASYARHRRAFGAPIASYPLVQDAIATCARAMAAIASAPPRCQADELLAPDSAGVACGHQREQVDQRAQHPEHPARDGVLGGNSYRPSPRSCACIATAWCSRAGKAPTMSWSSR
jgi:alkylation response protein AidB-like acyl-CoA dehydrogenase